MKYLRAQVVFENWLGGVAFLPLNMNSKGKQIELYELC